ncbi:hypothetical protein AADZ90_019355 [Aestuariibius sp. 2305UL40-4]|uniref:hypothetical protein n=1 Tax=Aestuariibius violaceus TaxID=3234132 RepID=UPI00345F1162
MDFCYDLIDRVTANIESFLADKPNQTAFEPEKALDHRAELWSRIGAQGDCVKALAEFNIRHNATGPAQTQA